MVKPKDYILHIDTQDHGWLKSNDSMWVYSIETPCLICETLSFLKDLQILCILSCLILLVASMVIFPK